jgi:predicted membrane metal-binding protein
MGSFFLLSPFFWRKSDSLTVWTRTFFLFHTLSPEMLFNVGSLLSFIVMLAIILAVRYSREMGFGRKVSFFAVMIAAWAASTPIMAHCFGRVTPGGILTGLLLMPFASLAVGFGILGALSGLCSVFVAAHLNNAAALMTKAMFGISWAVSRIPYANFEIRPWTIFECAAWYGVILLLLTLCWIRRNRKQESL